MKAAWHATGELKAECVHELHMQEQQLQFETELLRGNEALA